MRPKSWWEESKPGYTARIDAVEVLKRNEKAFGLLAPFLQEVMRECEVECFGYSGRWIAINEPGYVPSNTYRVRPDFKPEYAEEPKASLQPEKCEFCQKSPYIMCLNQNPLTGIICTRAHGHDGDHVSCGLTRHAIRRWPQEKQELKKGEPEVERYCRTCRHEHLRGNEFPCHECISHRARLRWEPKPAQDCSDWVDKPASKWGEWMDCEIIPALPGFPSRIRFRKENS